MSSADASGTQARVQKGLEMTELISATLAKGNGGRRGERHQLGAICKKTQNLKIWSFLLSIVSPTTNSEIRPCCHLHGVSVSFGATAGLRLVSAAVFRRWYSAGTGPRSDQSDVCPS